MIFDQQSSSYRIFSHTNIANTSKSDLDSSNFLEPKQYQTIFWGHSLGQYNIKQNKMAQIKINNTKQWPKIFVSHNYKKQNHPILYSSKPKTQQ